MSVNEVKICPPIVDIELCDWSIEQKKAIPVKLEWFVYTRPCPWLSALDPEIVCLSNDGWVTSIKAIAVFDTSVVPPTTTFYDFNGNVLSWYTVVKCDSVEYDIEKWADFCLAWQLITRYDIVNSETKLIESSYWVDALWVPQAAPIIWDLSARPCEQLCNIWSVWTIWSWSEIL